MLVGKMALTTSMSLPNTGDEMIKIVNATSEIPGMTREEVETFLESKLNLQLATIDQKGEPNIQP
ncbi:MAG: hypothetical protein ACJ71K_01265, partial [Nitrososphaeraceae archaeon]